MMLACHKFFYQENPQEAEFLQKLALVTEPLQEQREACWYQHRPSMKPDESE
jgi:hypothetical protein